MVGSTKVGITRSKPSPAKNDAFFTKPSIAEFCVASLDLSGFSYFVEPAAGAGSFLPFLPSETLAFDIAPMSSLVAAQDFLDYWVPFNEGTLVVGNPPFGYKSSLAIKFINHAVELGASVIAFILPKSFLKVSVFRKISRNVHIVNVKHLPSDSFTVSGESYSVPCVWVVLEVKPVERVNSVLNKMDLPSGFLRVQAADLASVWVRRIGVNAGLSGSDPHNFSPNSNYFLKIPDFMDAAELSRKISAIPVPADVHNTVGPGSLTVKDLSLRVREAVKQL